MCIRDSFYMRVGQSHRRVAPTMLIRSKRKGDKHGALCEGENAPGPSAPTVPLASIRRPEAPRDKDEFARVLLAGAGRRRRGGWAPGAGRAAVPLASAVGGGHEEAA
eukprot:3647493-Pleurochrysis_carterae.AAC.2